ncbi:hypothetical protein D3C83_112750 [compost metagenome]
MEHAIGLEFETRRLRNSAYPCARERRAFRRDDVDADRHVDIGAESIEIARAFEGRLRIGAACRRGQPFG